MKTRKEAALEMEFPFVVEKTTDMKRPTFSLKPSIPRVGPKLGRLDLRIFYDGVVIPSPHMTYLGGSEAHAYAKNTCQLTINHLEKLVNSLCVNPVSKIHFRVPEKSLDDGIRLLWSGSFNTLLALGASHEGFIEIFVEHEQDIEKGKLKRTDNATQSVSHSGKVSVNKPSGNVSGNDSVRASLGGVNTELDELSKLVSYHDQDSEDEVASLDHISEDESEEVINSRQCRLEKLIKKKERKRKKRESQRKAMEKIIHRKNNSEDGMDHMLHEEEECNEREELNEVHPTVGVGHTNELEPYICFEKTEELDDSGDEMNEEEKMDFLEEIRTCSKTVNLEDFHSDYEDSDQEFGDPLYDSEDEANIVQQNGDMDWPVFNPKLKWKLQEPMNGMLFKSTAELKHCIINYAVAHGRPIRFQHVTNSYLIARCRDGCPWRCYASMQQLVNTVQVKSYNPSHYKKVCTKNFTVKLVTSRWLAKEYAVKIRLNPKWDLYEFKELVKYRHGITVSLNQCYKARQIGLAEVESVLIQHYAKLWDYKEELARSNPGSTFVLVGKDSEDGNTQIFDKFYLCFSALKAGWLSGCRPVIGLDGCFLKSFVAGQLLCAVGRDGNNHMYPIAWAVVDVESTETWTWFMTLLKQDIGNHDGYGLTFISDEQKGLLNGLQSIFPGAEHRNCARHIYANFRKQFHGEALKNKFWNAAKCGTEEEFLNEMDGIKDLSVKAYNYLMGHSPEHWCRGYFSTLSCCDNVENNLSETFNSFILSARKKPIIRMLEDIRQALMVRLSEKKQFFLKCQDKLCPKARTKLDSAKSQFKHWEARNNGCGGFEVRKGLDGYSVDLGNRTCTCSCWYVLAQAHI